MVRATFFTVILIVLQLQHQSFAQSDYKDADEFNVAYQYQLNSPILFQHRVAIGQNEATVFLKVIRQNNELNINTINYEIKADYQRDEVVRKAELKDEQKLINDSNSDIYQFTFPLTENSKYLFIFLDASIRENNYTYLYDIALDTDQNFPLTDLLIMEADRDIPVFNPTLTEDTEFRLVSFYGEDSTRAFIYHYTHEFPPNLPPMAEGSAEVQKSLSIDTVLEVQMGQKLSFNEQGLYFCQTDTTSLSGISFRLTDNYYPRYVTAEGLIAPLRYISTSEEMDNLNKADNTKQALDRYWVKATRSRERAKDVIRDYYRQVYAANALFTFYKEGWKTGQGMVYTLFGAPDEVYRSATQERWIYNDENNLVDNLNFTFVKVRNIFTDQHYNLIRDEDYRRFWYRNIDLWRKGRKQI